MRDSSQLRFRLSKIEQGDDDGDRSTNPERAVPPDQPKSRNAPGAREWTERYGRDLTPLLLFGAGHVGRALVLALAPLPFRVSWHDTRENAFPPHIPANATPLCPGDPESVAACAPPGAFILVMTHEHPLDLAITAAALSRPDLPFVGLIGSGSKRARFEKRFREIGIPDERIAALVCPIGVAGIADKDPAVIAAATAAQLLQAREALSTGKSP
jgi:xanthine dehydrogenase accessory factor